MFKNRFLLVLGVLSLLFATMAVSKPFSNTPAASELSWPPRPVIIAVTGANALADYHERHRDLTSVYYQKYPGQWVSRAAGVAIPVTGSSAVLSDYFQRHSDLNALGGAGIAVDLTDYFVRHAELRTSSKSADLSWPPRPVIISVKGANSALSDYYERHSDLSAAAGTANASNEDYFQRHSGQEISRAAGVAIPV